VNAPDLATFAALPVGAEFSVPGLFPSIRYRKVADDGFNVVTFLGTVMGSPLPWEGDYVGQPVRPLAPYVWKEGLGIGPAYYRLDPFHDGWPNGHYECGSKGWRLVFSQNLRNVWLPADCENALTVVLLDAEDGKEYATANFFTAYERNGYPFRVMDADRNEPRPPAAAALQDYFYADHHCPCHRKADARRAGAVTDEECEGDRFKIARIECPKLPGLVLYSETMDSEELEATLGY
jgi:hypothetical protein